MYIGGQQADLGDDALILLNYTQEELTNPTVVKNSYTQQVTLKGTPTNNDIFGHIWRLDRSQQFGGSIGPDFDPSRKTSFQIFDGTGQLLESGYVKLDNVLRHGADIQYSVTLYGGLGSFLYSLAYDADGSRKTLASLDYLVTGDPDRELDFTIDASAVQQAWDRLISEPSSVTTLWDVINFAPCYNGVPDRFTPSKGLINPSALGLPAAHPDDDTYGTLNGWALLNMTKDMTEWEAKDLRSYLQRPVLSVKAVLEAIARLAVRNGYSFDSSVLDGSNYDGMWLTLPLLPSLDNYKTVQRVVPLTLDGTPASDSFSVPVTVDTTLQVGSKVDVSMNLSFGVTASGASVSPLNFSQSRYSGGIGTTERYDFSGIFAQLVAYDSEDRILAASKVVCVGSSQDYGQLAKDGKVRADAVGYTPQVATDYTFVEAALAGSSGSYQLTTDLNLTVSCYNAASYRIWVTPYHFRKTIHFGEFYRKTWRSHAVGSSAMTVYSGGNEYAYTAMTLSSGSAGSTASYKTPESVRSGAAVTKAMLLTTDYTPADFLLSLVKSLGMILRYDSITKAVTLMSRNDFYKSGTIDINTRIDRGRDINVTPLAFDTKWLELSIDTIGGAFEDYYEESYGMPYGIQKVDTGYDFNSEAKKIMDSVVFRSGVQGCESSRYFNDVTAGGIDVLSQQLDAGNTVTYRNTTGDTKDAEIPVVSSPEIAYWGSSSFDDVEGYDHLLACKLQCHAADGKPVDGAGVLLFQTGVQYYDRFKISDDLTEMMTLNDGTPCWRMDAGPGVTVPVFSRYRTSPIYTVISDSPLVVEYRGEGITTALDFGRAQELNCPHMAYFPNEEEVTVYEKMWRIYFRDRYDVDTRVVTAWVNMAGLQVDGDSLRHFYWFDGSLWVLNRIINYSVTTDDPVQCEFVKVQDESAYLYGQHFGGSQLRGTLDITVTPATATVSVDGRTIALTSGQASVTLTAGQHLVEVSAPGYATESQVVTIRPEETTTLTVTLQLQVGRLTITVLPEGVDPTIVLKVNGTTTAYVAGMGITAGATVSVTLSKTNYATVTDSFTMPVTDVTKTYTMVASINATISFPKEISSAAQAVRMTVSDPSNHGWLLDFSMANYFEELVTGGAVVSGSATADSTSIEGIGDAVITLSITRNSSTQDRDIGKDPAVIHFYDTTRGYSYYTNVWITQLGTSSSSVLVTSITLNKTSLSLNAGSSEKLTATVLPANATNPYLTWSSSNTSVASVGQDGTVYANAAGTCTITAAATDGSGKTATCTVTVTTPWTMSVDDIQVLSTSESASSVLRVSGIQVNTITASCDASWVTSAQADTTGSPYYIRLEITQNESQVARSATVTVTALTTSGTRVMTTFVITQSGRTSSDVPCTSMTITGPDALANSNNKATYSVDYLPAGCTQDQCVWSLSDPDNMVALVTNGDSCTLEVTDPSANNHQVTLTCRNYYNGNVFATKTVMATYIGQSSAIEVSTGYVTVDADSMGDTTPVLSLASGVNRSDLVITKTGFLSTANVSTGLHVVTSYSKNEGDTVRAGTVVITYTDPTTQVISRVEIYYLQAKPSGVDASLRAGALNISEASGTVTAVMQVIFHNQENTSFTFKGLGWTIVGLDANEGTVFTKTGTWAERTVASKSTEIGTYTATWSGTIGTATHYTLTVRNGTTMSDTHSTDGHDQIIQ